MSEKTLNFIENKVEYIFKIELKGEVGMHDSATNFLLSISEATNIGDTLLSSDMYVIYTPSGNCQTSIIGKLCNLVYILKNDYLFKIGVRNTNNILKTVFSFIQSTMKRDRKTLYIVDYKEHIDTKVSELFKFRTKSPYISTNKSRMILGLIEIKNYK